MLLFFKWFFLWFRQSFMSLYIRHRNCVIILCEFCLCSSFRNEHVCKLPISASMRDTCLNPDEEYTLLKIVFYEIWPCLESILQQKQNCLQDSDTNYRTTPKVGRTICFLHFRYVPRIVNYSVLTQAVPRIILIKISPTQVNIFIISITFLSWEFQCWWKCGT